MRCVCLLLLLLLSAFRVEAQEKPAVLMLDVSASTVSGARYRMGFERFPIGAEKPVWEDPTGRADSTAVSLLAGGGLIGAGFGDAHAQEQRNATIQRLRTAVEQDKRLYNTIESALRTFASGHGYPISETFVAPSVAEGFVARAIPGKGVAVMAKRDPGRQMVMLSWDNRQPLLAVDVRRYQKSDGGRLPVREQAAQTLRYVGYPAPATVDAIEYWAADGATRFMAETEAGLAAMLPLAWNADIEIPSVSRKEKVSLRVGDQELEFPGRLWKQEGALAYVFNGDDGITIVRTQPMTGAMAAGAGM